MTKNVFLQCYSNMNGRDTVFGGGSILLESGSIIKGVKKIDFNIEKEKIYVYCLDTYNRKIFLQSVKNWLLTHKNLKDFIYPVIIRCIDRRYIRHINYPYKVKQLTLEL